MRFLILLGIVFLFPHAAGAQNRPEAPYLLPQTIFVGDSGRLVVPLGSAGGIEPFVFELPENKVLSQDLLIRRVELEHRGGNSRILIDFIPYAPGTLPIPALDYLFPGETELNLPPLEVQVASILNPSNMSLSEPAAALTVPGTSLLIYGTISLVIIILLLGIGGSYWVRLHFRDFWERSRRRHLLRSMRKFIRRFRHECTHKKNVSLGDYLTILSSESRKFLSLFTGINCHSLTAGEFLSLPLKQLNPASLCVLFKTWDTLRFSGWSITINDIGNALDETEKIVVLLEKAEKEKPLPGQDKTEVMGAAS